eukprot:933434-Pelagomonas_calceolata.AAC.2
MQNNVHTLEQSINYKKRHTGFRNVNFLHQKSEQSTKASVLPAQSSIPSAAPSSAPPWQTSPAIQTAPAAASGLHAAAHSTSAPSHWYSGSSCSGTCVLPGGSSPACCKWQQIWGLMTSTLKHRAPCCSRRRPHAKLVV